MRGLTQRVEHAAATHGHLLDGFPRTVGQARQLEETTRPAGVSVQTVLFLDVDEAERVARMRYRAPEEHRSDDNETTMRHRLRVFADETRPSSTATPRAKCCIDSTATASPMK